jgi:predicted transcriptional regulator
MNVQTIVNELLLSVKCRPDRLGAEVTGGFAGDLLSDVMANSAAGHIWITRQTHQNIVAVASLKDHAGIIIVQGAEPEADTVDKAAAEGIPVMVSPLHAFELAGKIYRLLSS